MITHLTHDNPRPTRRFLGSEPRKAPMLLVGLIILAVLFFAFFKTAMIVAIIYLAVSSAKKHLTAQPLRIKWFTAALGVVALAIVTYVFYSAIHEFYVFARAHDHKSLADLFRPQIISYFENAHSKIGALLPVDLFDKKNLIKFAGDAAEFLASGAMAIALGIPAFALNVVFAIIVLILLARKHGRVREVFAKALSRNTMGTVLHVTRLAEKSAYGSLFGILSIAIVQATLLSFGAKLYGVAWWPIVFIVAMATSMIPPTGILPLGAIVATYIGFSHGVSSALVFSGITVVAFLSEQGIKAVLFSTARNGLPAPLCLIGAIGGLMIFGVSGLLIGPFLIYWASLLFSDIGESHP